MKYSSFFVTGTDTDIGKTYVTALIVKALYEKTHDAGYYKAAISGASNIAESDAGYVKQISGISQPNESMVSYLFEEAVSPHLAAKHSGVSIEMEKIRRDFSFVQEKYTHVVMEGSGGILCPIRRDEQEIWLEDIIRMLQLPVVLVSDAGLGTINHTLLTVYYLHQKNIPIEALILNRYKECPPHRDNKKVLHETTDIDHILCVKEHATSIELW